MSIDPARGASMPAGAVADAVGLGASRGLGQALASLRGLIGARVLGPTTYGVWQGVRIALVLADLSHLGAQNALEREIPLARGADDAARAAGIRLAGLRATLAGVAPVVLGCALLAALAARRDDGALGAALAAAGAAALLQQLFHLAAADLRAEARFRRSAASGLAAAATGAALAYPLARALGLAGFVAATALGMAAGLAVARRPGRAVPPSGSGAADGPRAWRGLALGLVRTGLPILLIHAVRPLKRTVDKAAILALAGATAAGLYGIGDTLAALLVILPGSAAAVVAPRALERFARTGDPSGLREAVAAPMDILSRTVPALAGLGAIAAEVAIHGLLPRFEAGVPAAKVLALTALAAAIEGPALNAIVAIGRQGTAALVSLAFVATATAGQIAVLVAGLGIEAVAGVAVVVGFGQAVAVAGLGYRWLDAGPAGTARALGPPLARLGYGGLAFLAVEAAAARGLLPGGAAVRAAVFLAAVAPLAWRLRAGLSGLRGPGGTP